MIEIIGKHTTAIVMIDQVEATCVSQIYHFVNHLAFTNLVVIMPDTHAGKGSVIGFTMELTDKVIPNVVGVDISCGMLSLNFGIKNIPISLEEFDRRIRQQIPFGVNVHDNAVVNMKNDFPWKRVNVLAEKFAMAYLNKFGVRIIPPKYSMDWFLEKCKIIGADTRRVINSLGTLGGGNHFIETGVSTVSSDDFWVTIHSGSRNFGKRICDLWQHKAVKILKVDKKAELDKRIIAIREKHKYEPRKIKEEVKKTKQELNLDHGIDMKGCEWLEGESASGYLFDMIFSQIYAEVNRKCMARIIENILKKERVEEIETVHNFIDFQDFMIRKGAIRSYKNEEMIIPFNMRDGILICEGKSNSEWNYSAPHGAGRLLSRSQARKQLDVEEFKDQMNGIYSTSVGSSTIDEAPNAYKNANMIEGAIKPTATIINRIKPIHNMKDKSIKLAKGKPTKDFMSKGSFISTGATNNHEIH